MEIIEKTDVTEVTVNKTETVFGAADTAEPEEVKTGKKKRRRKKLHEINTENDIKFRGPLSYRHLRIFAWVFLAMAQVGAFLSIASKIDPVWGGGIAWITNLMSFFGDLTLPMFLFAAFAVIDRKSVV